MYIASKNVSSIGSLGRCHNPWLEAGSGNMLGGAGLSCKNDVNRKRHYAVLRVVAGFGSDAADSTGDLRLKGLDLIHAAIAAKPEDLVDPCTGKLDSFGLS